MDTAFTQEWPDSIVQAAQYLGARANGYAFCPRWMINRMARQGRISVRQAKRKTYRKIRVISENGKRAEEAEVKYTKNRKNKR